jgi:site-specific recombinase XerD
MDFTKLIFEFEKEMIRKRYSPRSISCYKSCLSGFLYYFEEYPERINRQEIKDYLYEQTILNKSPQSIIQIISSLKKFYIFIGQPKKLNGFENPKTPQKLIQPLSVQQVKSLIDSFDNIKHKAIIQTLYSGGLRISELLNLEWSHLHRDRRLIFVKSGKGNKDRFVPLYSNTINVLEKYWYKYKTKGRIFHGQNKDIYTASSVRALLKPFNVYPHLLRHSYLTHLHEKGISLRTIQKIAGHNSSRTTERYTKVSNYEIGNIIYPLAL